jgi:hypothetical protein
VIVTLATSLFGAASSASFPHPIKTMLDATTAATAGPDIGANPVCEMSM